MVTYLESTTTFGMPACRLSVPAPLTCRVRAARRCTTINSWQMTSNMTEKALPQGAPDRAIQDTLHEAMGRHQQGDLFEADLLYAQTLRMDPDNQQALRLRGILAREHGDLERSLELLQRACELAPDDAGEHRLDCHRCMPAPGSGYINQIYVILFTQIDVIMFAV